MSDGAGGHTYNNPRGVKRDVNGESHGEEVLITHPMHAVAPEHPFLKVRWVQSWGGRKRYVCPIPGCRAAMQTHEYISKLEQHALTHLSQGHAANGSAMELLAFALGKQCPGVSARLPMR